MTAVDLIIFGATGDLSARKLFPALYQLDAAKLLQEDLRIAAVGRQQQSVDDFRQDLRQKMSGYMREAIDDVVWTRFVGRLDYLASDFAEPQAFEALSDWLDDSRVSLFYLATPPSLFSTICERLHDDQCLTGPCRIVLEKPIGESLATSSQVNETLARFFNERDIYRIDHYLGKETVQNLMALRFANVIFETQWNNNHIDHVQITVAETVGVDNRAAYYDAYGAIRDMVQNHLMQLVCLVAMEPPSHFNADQVRDEKLRVLRAIRPLSAGDISRGQYQEYAQELGSPSDTETYVAMKLAIDNWRWAGVPFYIRTGKKLARRASEIVITFKQRPHDIFQRNGGGDIDSPPNRLIIRLQPSEGLRLQLIPRSPARAACGCSRRTQPQLRRHLRSAAAGSPMSGC